MVLLVFYFLSDDSNSLSFFPEIQEKKVCFFNNNIY